MKRFISVVLLLVVILSFALSGCKDNKGYIVYNENIIKIGVILSQSEDSAFGAEVLEGVQYASELAPNVNMNGKYLIQLTVCDINDDINASADKLINENVAAVICAAETKTESEKIIKAFDGQDTPLLFVGCYSNDVIDDPESFILSVPYSYQSSVAASHFTSEGLMNGSVIYANDDYSADFASTFKKTFVDSGGSSVEMYTEFDAASIAKSNTEFVYIIGEPEYALDVFTELKSAGAKMPLICSEIFNKSTVETTAYNDMLYISKFEIDVNNYIGADFLSVFSASKNISKDEISSAQGYGYDAYMLIYGALIGFNSSSFSSDKTDDKKDDNKDVTTTELKEAIAKITHLGVTDSISFDAAGRVNTNFVYISKIQNAHSTMINRYNYSNESSQ